MVALIMIVVLLFAVPARAQDNSLQDKLNRLKRDLSEVPEDPNKLSVRYFVTYEVAGQRFYRATTGPKSCAEAAMVARLEHPDAACAEAIENPPSWPQPK
jgi:hypothetical protein